MRRIFLGFLLLLGIGLSGCASPKVIKNRKCTEKSTIMVISNNGNNLRIDKKIVEGDTSLSMLLTPLPHDLSSLSMIDGCDGIFFLKGGLDSASRKYTIIIQDDTIIIPENDSLYKCMLEYDKMIVGTDTILLSSPLVLGNKEITTCIIEGDKYIVGKDTFSIPKYKKDIIIMNGDTIKIDEFELNDMDHKCFKIIKVIDNDSAKVKIEVNGKEITDPQKEEL